MTRTQRLIVMIMKVSVCLAMLLVMALGTESAPAKLVNVKGSTKASHGRVVNVRNFGAVGNGLTDDTAAIQAAIDAASKTGGGGVVYIPAGHYLISKTLVIHDTKSLILRGTGSGGFARPYKFNRPRSNGTDLIWTGQAGGTLMELRWSGAIIIKDLVLDGRDVRHGVHAAQAGILLHMVSRIGGGTMLQHISNMSFIDARVGLQMGGGRHETAAENDSDVLFDFLTFRSVDVAFKTTQQQAVDYLFNFVFGLGCGTVFDIKAGGNLMVNNAQLTSCVLAVNIQGGGKNSGTYLFNNMRCEAQRRGTTTANPGRWQLLKAYPSGQALVRFTNFDDCQWYWFEMPSAREKRIPLCQIGPAATVVFNTSIFNGPIARLDGTKASPAVLELHNCNLNYVTPTDALAANPYGYFRVIRCRNGVGPIFPNLIKWPALKTVRLKANRAYVGQTLKKSGQ